MVRGSAVRGGRASKGGRGGRAGRATCSSVASAAESAPLGLPEAPQDVLPQLSIENEEGSGIPMDEQESLAEGSDMPSTTIRRRGMGRVPEVPLEATSRQMLSLDGKR